MNGMDAWKALKEGLVVTHDGDLIRAYDGMMQWQDLDGHWHDMSLDMILTSYDFMIKFPE